MRISPSISRFSCETLLITSPLITVVLFQTGTPRVEETTYLGKLFNLSANGPLRDGHPRREELVAPPAQQNVMFTTSCPAALKGPVSRPIPCTPASCPPTSALKTKPGSSQS